MKRRIVRLLWIPPIIAGVLLLGFRIAFDLHVHRSGHTFILPRSSPDGYDALLRLPRGYHDYAGPRPLLIMLHGAGDVGRDVASFREPDWPEKLASEQFPFLVLVPVSDKPEWESRRIAELVEQLQESSFSRVRIDPTRIYLTGYSMGGFGTFQTAVDYPDLFAAIAPVAGGGEPLRGEKLQKVPVWAFHGERDEVVPPPSSTRMLAAIQASGNPEARLTLIPEAGHGIAREVYANPELYQWLLSHRRSDSEDVSDQ